MGGSRGVAASLSAGSAVARTPGIRRSGVRPALALALLSRAARIAFGSSVDPLVEVAGASGCSATAPAPRSPAGTVLTAAWAIVERATSDTSGASPCGRLGEEVVHAGLQTARLGAESVSRNRDDRRPAGGPSAARALGSALRCETIEVGIWQSIRIAA